MNAKFKPIFKITLFAMLLTLCWCLPFFTANIQYIGNMLLPMHLPVFICGFALGPFYGLALGIISPISRSFMFGFPNFFPNAIGMAFELGAYGFISGLLYRVLLKIKKLPKIANLYVSLITSQLIGRIIWGASRLLLFGLFKSEFSWTLFITNAFLTALPGLILQWILVPILVLLFERITKNSRFKKSE